MTECEEELLVHLVRDSANRFVEVECTEIVLASIDPDEHLSTGFHYTLDNRLESSFWIWQVMKYSDTIGEINCLPKGEMIDISLYDEYIWDIFCHLECEINCIREIDTDSELRTEKCWPLGESPRSTSDIECNLSFEIFLRLVTSEKVEEVRFLEIILLVDIVPFECEALSGFCLMLDKRIEVLYLIYCSLPFIFE